MNNEEKQLPETPIVEENNTPEKKKLPTGALIGIICGAVALVVAAILLVVLLLPGADDGCQHIDKDDDYLCDNCGEHFDDGDEPIDPLVTNATVNFIVKLEDGTPLEGVKFSLLRGEQILSLVTGNDGSVKQLLDYGAYSIEVDYETLPEYCYADVLGIKVQDGTGDFVITVIDNKPDGSVDKPLPILENDTEISLEPGDELYFTYRGATIKYLTINSDKLEVSYKDETYSAEDGVISVTISPESIGEMTIFSVKNISDSSVSTTMKVYAPEGSDENPIELTENSATVSVTGEETKYYTYIADKDGVLILTTPTTNSNISVTRFMVKEIDGETIEIPTVSQQEGAGSLYVFVKAGEKVKIAVATANSSGEENDYVIDFSVNVHAATDVEPLVISSCEIYLSIDAYASVVFSASESVSITISADEGLVVSQNGTVLTPTQNGKYTINLTSSDVISVENNLDENQKIIIN